MPRRLQPPPLGIKYRVVCPYCDKQWVTKVTSNPHEIQCGCGKKTNILIATVRGKHSRKHDNYREYHVRVVLGEGEREITFIDNPNYDMPMRSSDLVAFYYSVGDRRIILQVNNMTIHRYWETTGKIGAYGIGSIKPAIRHLQFVGRYGYSNFFSYKSILEQCEKDADLKEWVDTFLVKKVDI